MITKFKTVDRQFLLAVGVLVGNAIGAGIFSLPYIAAQVGFVPTLLLVGLVGALCLVSNLMFGEITLRTRESCRLVRHAEIYLGYPAKHLTLLVTFLSFYASLLVYMIMGGTFLFNLLHPLLGGTITTYAVAFWLVTSVVVYLNLKFFSLIESWLTLFMLVLFVAIIVLGVPEIDFAHLQTFHPGQLFLPYGALLFSLGSMTVIPSMEEIITERRERIKPAIIWGTVIYVLIHAVFILVVLGVSGAGTTPEAFVGLSDHFGNGIVALGLLVGFLAVFTSHLTTAVALKEVFAYDYGIPHFLAWLSTVVVPIVVLLLGLNDFIKVMDYAGAVAGGICGIIVTLIFYVAKQKGNDHPPFEFNFSKTLASVIIVLYLLGVIYQFIYGQR